jgi:3-phenylpropionate/cinnamic acid dioxygenase small subunit
VIDVQGREAEADVHVYGNHSFKRKHYWSFYGRYVFTLEKESKDWKISSLRYIFHGQQGSPDAVPR